MQQGEQEKALAMRQQAADLFGKENLPQLDQMVALQLPKEQIQRWTQATAATQGGGQALTALEGEVAAKGETPEDRAGFLRARNEATGVANSLNGNVMRNLAARGLSNSGLGLAASMAANQHGINATNQADVQGAADARSRYLQSVGALGQLSGQQRGQEMQAMSAQDALNEFNLNNAQNAQAYNLNLPQQQFGNQMQLASGKANALNGVANQYNTMGATQAAAAGRAGQTGVAGQTYGGGAQQPAPTDASYWQGGQTQPTPQQGYDPNKAWNQYGNGWA